MRAGRASGVAASADCVVGPAGDGPDAHSSSLSSSSSAAAAICSASPSPGSSNSSGSGGCLMTTPSRLRRRRLLVRARRMQYGLDEVAGLEIVRAARIPGSLRDVRDDHVIFVRRADNARRFCFVELETLARGGRSLHLFERHTIETVPSAAFAETRHVVGARARRRRGATTLRSGGAAAARGVRGRRQRSGGR